jgi:hypothetical protein
MPLRNCYCQDHSAIGVQTVEFKADELALNSVPLLQPEFYSSAARGENACVDLSDPDPPLHVLHCVWLN